ncbi:MAG: DNA polymerase III subunit gamma/tau [Chitinophagales bacterium]|nr:DNA polymerase III subunit gamma/tau [Bacteroidota bacterium]MCB9044406.1 DNA polymerase III subunit gamma/tau [Chitinophagales bacterium]
MSNYLVSARKYRPLQFIDVVGQEHITTTLKNALRNGHIAQSYLFNGPRGVGKTTCARILAKTLNCYNPTADMEACGTCDSCTSFQNAASFNIFELDAASNNTVEGIRSLIEQVRFAPQQGKYKVYIIDEVHMLSTAAFNAFLKTLEEPPSYAVFILATTEKHKVLPTIISRCQVFDFSRIQIPAMVQHLKKICTIEGLQADERALHLIAEKADGGLRDALSIFDRIAGYTQGSITFQAVLQNLNVLDYDYFFNTTEALLAQDTTQALLYLNEIILAGFEPEDFIDGLAQHFRNLLFAKNPATFALIQHTEEVLQRYYSQAAICPNAFVISAMSIANDCALQYKQATNKQLLVELALVKLAHLHQIIKVEKLNISSPENTVEKKNPPNAVVNEPSVQQYQTSYVPLQKEKENTVLAPQKVPTITENVATNEQVETETFAQKAEETEPTTSGKTLRLNLSMDAILANKNNETKENKRLDKSSLEKLWAKFVAKIESQAVKSTCQEITLELEEKTIVTVVDSTLKQVQIREEVASFIAQLSAEGYNAYLFDVQIDKSLINTNEKIPFTPYEKMEVMKEENPAFSDFIQKFQLSLLY